ncbi:hypothetical protein [Streptococcus halichoeri]|uniref:hypothetical protein n=1 Tax=Streptococcus halichoeri TaxID=254785 RepID=UPI00135AD668|nr:hypothetical protein [Streptococcus halichoeri]
MKKKLLQSLLFSTALLATFGGHAALAENIVGVSSTDETTPSLVETTPFLNQLSYLRLTNRSIVKL